MDMTDSEANCDIMDLLLDSPERPVETMPFNLVDSLNEDDFKKMNNGEREFDPQYTSDNEFGDEKLELECPRGANGDESLGSSFGHLDEEDIAPLVDAAKMKTPEAQTLDDGDAKKIRQIRSFLKGVRSDAEWSRECPVIRIAMSPELRDEISESIGFLAQNYNRRPKYVTFTTKFWSIEDVLNFVESAFVGSKKPSYRSTLMVICKNPTNSLMELAKPLLARISLVGVRAEFGPIYAEKVFKAERKRIRMSTKDLKAYMMHESQARSLGLDMNTSFQLTRKGDNHKDFSIQWYDTIHSNGERYTVVHLNHCLYPNGMMFGTDREHVVEHSFYTEVKAEDLMPVSCALPPVGDLIEYILAHQVGESKL